MLSKADVFALGIPHSGGAAAGERSNPFKKTKCITLPQASPITAANLDVFAAEPARVQTLYDNVSDCAIYLIGRPSHPSIRRGPELMRWCAEMTLRESPVPLRAVLGHYVILIDDRRNKEIRFVTDVLGLRPWIVGARGNRLVAGTSVLPICAAGLSEGKVDYDAVASWLKLNYVLSDQTVVTDYRYAPAGAVSIFDPSGKQLAVRSHSSFQYDFETIDQEELIPYLYEQSMRSFAAQMDSVSGVTLPLSGGYDSRVLLAMAQRVGTAKINLINISNMPSETIIAREVAKTLGHPLKIIPISHHVLDLFNDPFAITGGGFPTGRNLTCKTARMNPGTPVLAGFMGDQLMRSALTPMRPAHFLKEEQECSTTNLAESLIGIYAAKTNRLHLFDDAVYARINQRVQRSAEAAIDRNRACGKPLTYIDFFYAARRFYAGNFLQHLDVAEAIVPFPTYELISCRTRHVERAYRPDNHQVLFNKYFPEIAHIPHNRHIDSALDANSHRAREARGASRHLRCWSLDILLHMLSSRSAAGANRKRLMRRVSSGLLGSARYQTELAFVAKLRCFERCLWASGVQFDWSAL